MAAAHRFCAEPAPVVSPPRYESAMPDKQQKTIGLMAVVLVLLIGWGYATCRLNWALPAKLQHQCPVRAHFLGPAIGRTASTRRIFTFAPGDKHRVAPIFQDTLWV